MATKKAVKRKSSRSSSRAVSEYKGKALAGKAKAAKEWDPAQAIDANAPMLLLEEVKEPRPYTSRYPIPDEEFRALKEAAPRAKLARKTAATAKDSGRKQE